MKRYYSLREISSELDIPKSTIVKYKDYFQDFLPMSGEGKRKKFEESALGVLSMIRELREERKLDWMEIKQVLAEKFGEPEQPEVEQSAVVATVQQVAPVNLDYIEHMVAVIGSQLMMMTRAVEQSRKISAETDRKVEVLSKRVVEAERKTDLVIGELLNRDDSAGAGIEELTGGMRKEFDRINVGMQHLAEVTGKSSTNGDFQKKLEALADRIESMAKDVTLFQSKYQVLLRENEVLKGRIRQMGERYPEKPEEAKRGGWLSRFKRD
ncbi:MAG TPA: MerR family transcriptional regulator [bacterium]|mgnify:CR=1 FL=1|nr:MerR family transcriptional regulator [bacterium]